MYNNDEQGWGYSQKAYNLMEALCFTVRVLSALLAPWGKVNVLKIEKNIRSIVIS